MGKRREEEQRKKKRERGKGKENVEEERGVNRKKDRKGEWK